MVPLQLMSISGKELHVSVLPLHVPERPFLGRGHPNGLGRGLRSLGLSPRRGRLGEGEPLEGCAGSGAGAGTASSAGTVFGGLALFCSRVADLFASGLVRAVGGSAGVGTVAGAGSGSGSAGSAGSAAAGSGSEATGGPHCQPFLLRIILFGRSPRKSQRKRWSRGYLRRCRLHLSI